MTSPSTATTISTGIRTSAAAIVSMVGIVRLNFLLAGALEVLVALAEPEALVVLAGLETLVVLAELVAWVVPVTAPHNCRLEAAVAIPGSTTPNIAAVPPTGIVLRRIGLAGQLAETPSPIASLVPGNRLVDRAAILPAIAAVQELAIVWAAVQELAAGAVEPG
jgi:hypothetical protein